MAALRPWRITPYLVMCIVCIFSPNQLFTHAENIAQGKPTRQHGTWNHFGSEKAVDGKTAQVPDSLCAFPNALDHSLDYPYQSGVPSTWWSVDLADGNEFKAFVIENVTIYFRQCCPERIIGVLILVGSNADVTTHRECAKITTGDSIQTLPCHPSTPVRFLTVKHPTNAQLGLCEVIVNGYEGFTWPQQLIGEIAMGAAMIVIIITVIVISKRRKSCRTNGTTVLSTKKTYAPANAYEPPDIIQPLYEEIAEKGRWDLPIVKSHAPGNAYDDKQPLYEEIAEKGSTLGTYGQYELLNTQNMFNQWMVDNHIDSKAQEKLYHHGISTMQDINDLSHQDMIEIGLNVGERNRIKKAKERVFKKY